MYSKIPNRSLKPLIVTTLFIICFFCPHIHLWQISIYKFDSTKCFVISMYTCWHFWYNKIKFLITELEKHFTIPNTKIITTTSKTIEDLVRKKKHRIDNVSEAGIYKIKCLQQYKKYIDKISRNLMTHIYEHRRDLFWDNLLNSFISHRYKTSHDL